MNKEEALQKIDELKKFVEECDDEYKKWEYLDGDGLWHSRIFAFKDYRNDLTSLNYNFQGGYKYFVGTTPCGFKVIWRVKNEDYC